MDAFCAQLGATCGGLLFQIMLELLVLPLGILIALWYDDIGKPRIDVRPAKPVEFKQGAIRHLYLAVENLPRSGPLVRRKTAHHAHGTLSVYRSSGEPVFEHMPLRWAGNPEPVDYHIDQPPSVPLGDHRLLRLSRFMNLPPDSVELIDTFMRVEGEEYAYGFNESSYLHDRRNPDYRVPPGEYIVKIRLRNDDNQFPVHECILHNPADFAGFRLVEKP